MSKFTGEKHELSCLQLSEIPKCDFCNEKDAVAYWDCYSESHVYICRSCALEALPKLIADAVVPSSEFMATRGRLRSDLYRAEEKVLNTLREGLLHTCALEIDRYNPYETEERE